MVLSGSARRRTRPALLVDGRHLSGFGATRGFGRYLRAILAHLVHDAPFDVEVLVTPDAASAVHAGVRPALVSRRAPGRLSELEHHLRLPVDIALHPSRLFLSPAHDPPRWCGRPWVQTLHDVPLAFA